MDTCVSHYLDVFVNQYVINTGTTNLVARNDRLLRVLNSYYCHLSGVNAEHFNLTFDLLVLNHFKFGFLVITVEWSIELNLLR